jgi:polyhydroxyalkanoate synthesis regulator phasin
MKVIVGELNQARIKLEALKYCAKDFNQVKKSEIESLERKIQELERQITIGNILK